MERPDDGETMPASIPRPDIMDDFPVWLVTHWSAEQIHGADERWLTKIMLANAENTRIHNELYDRRYRVDDSAETTGRHPVTTGDLADFKASSPKYAGVPDEALAALFARQKPRRRGFGTWD